MLLHLLNLTCISGLPCAFYKDLCKFMKSNSFVFLMDWLEAIPLLNPLNFVVVKLLIRKGALFDLNPIQNRVSKTMQI